MERAILISIKPKYCDLIANGKKTIEIRKTQPKLRTPFKCYIYCTKGKDNLYNVDNRIVLNNYKVTFDTNGNALETIYQLNGTVIGEFICDYIIDMHDHGDAFIAITDINLERCCLNYNQLHNYANGKTLFGWHISNLIIYDEPIELSVFDSCNRGHEQPDCKCIGVCDDCPYAELRRPPQSWCYVEELI